MNSNSYVVNLGPPPSSDHRSAPSHSPYTSYTSEMDNLKRRQKPSSAPNYSEGYDPVPVEEGDRSYPEKDEKHYKPPPRLSSNKVIASKDLCHFVLEGAVVYISLIPVHLFVDGNYAYCRTSQRLILPFYVAFYQQYDEIIVPVVLTFLAFWTRFRLISKSNIVVWDEFGSHYLKREFYFDVHPPLGKMLVGLSGLLAGYDGSFEFKSGEVYPENVNYTFMRLFNAAFGALMVPLAYFTAIEFKFSKQATLLAASMVLMGGWVGLFYIVVNGRRMELSWSMKWTGLQ
ncbi:Dolichyl-phosphate-mannose-protein mannosyltransferase-domain-containing protein [Jimgerdemannia flammicorona]|uniref:Dolichyl-phosphate-mannose-protein mannosyltransferase-domain-containing protein n=1 Tax=Jimgerdemannia flammicorona TaxID=994334 RepID=A0A433Q5A3_9FUNG|nr:Dolichyl-phosphate-mannose-protein mannosyltransferase-domain-containing protein [Jimgerdemannia flammicorona]